jgi:rsbT antagonist protein RsbS
MNSAKDSFVRYGNARKLAVRFGLWFVGFDSRRRTPRVCAHAASDQVFMRVPILKQGEFVIASIQSALSDEDLLQLRDDLAAHVGRYRSKGVIVDVTVLDVMDSFATRTVRDLAQMVRLRGARTVIVGIQPEVAFAMVQLGLELGNVATALDLEEGLALLRHEAK